jgi:putative transposase
MLLTHQYKLRLTKAQEATFDRWLELCRRQYNYRLWERFDWYEMQRCPINACPLVSSIAQPKEYPDYYWQKRDLVNSKKLFPEYKELPSHTLQEIVARVDKAFDRWIKVDSTDKRLGKPRFKGKGRYHSLAFADPIKPEHIRGNRIQLPKIGEIRVIMHRAIPDGFKVKNATVTKKSDGWYIIAGWGQFLQILSVKAASAGQGAIAVNPNGTSQNCSGCGAHVPKTLADRWHRCPHCGLEMDRDVNAAKNIVVHLDS